MEYLLTAAEMAQADRFTSEVIGIPSLVLMERAALGVAAAVRADHPDPSRHARCAVVAGAGNNGADALAAGRMLIDAGYEVQFFLVRKSADKAPGADASEGRQKNPPDGASAPETAMDRQIRILRAYGREPAYFDEERFAAFRPDIILDGLFGTGLDREVSGLFASAIRGINRAGSGWGAYVCSVDIPSGVDGSTGRIMGEAVHADVTVTFAFYKRGHFLYPGCTCCGRLLREEIGITRRSLPKEPEMFTYLGESAGKLLPARDCGGNKGTFGKVLVVAGSDGVSGACTMCAQAVLRMGSGMVKVYTHEGNRVILQETVPEAMCTSYGRNSVPESYDLDRLLGDLRWADVVVAGPGMGRDERALHILQRVLEYAAGEHEGRYGLVIDADAIRLIAEQNLYDLLKAAAQASSVILTPHMAEGAALLRTGVKQLREEPVQRARDFADRFSCTVVLKDARTLVVSHSTDRVYLNTTGNDGLATAGSGDVLTGIQASCLSQGMPAFEAACAACCIHGMAAQRVTERMDRRSLTATDLIGVLRPQDPS